MQKRGEGRKNRGEERNRVLGGVLVSNLSEPLPTLENYDGISGMAPATMSCLVWSDLITLADPSVSTKPVSAPGVSSNRGSTLPSPIRDGAVNRLEGALIGDFRANFRVKRPDNHQPRGSVACVDVGFMTKVECENQDNVSHS